MRRGGRCTGYPTLRAGGGGDADGGGVGDALWCLAGRGLGVGVELLLRVCWLHERSGYMSDGLMGASGVGVQYEVSDVPLRDMCKP